MILIVAYFFGPPCNYCRSLLSKFVTDKQQRVVTNTQKHDKGLHYIPWDTKFALDWHVRPHSVRDWRNAVPLSTPDYTYTSLNYLCHSQAE